MRVLSPPSDDPVERTGISEITAPKSAEHPRRGGMYSRSLLAAGVPIMAHPTEDHEVLLAYSHWWTDAARGNAPGQYGARTERDDPFWAVVTRGAEVLPVSSASRQGGLMPIPSAAPSGTLRGASGTGAAVFVLMGGQQGVVSARLDLTRSDGQYTASLRGALSLPPLKARLADGSLETADFDGGTYVRGRWVYVFGRGRDSGLMYVARRPPVAPRPESWEFRSSTGWSRYSRSEVDEAVRNDLLLSGASPDRIPVLTDTSSEVRADPLPIPSIGMTSSASLGRGDRLLMTAERRDGQDYSAAYEIESWHSRPQKIGEVRLGVEDQDYPAGGGARLTPDLPADPTHPAFDPEVGLRRGVPYVLSEYVGGGAGIANRWGLVGT